MGAANNGRSPQTERKIVTAVQLSEQRRVKVDLTLVTVVVPCGVCGNPARGTRFTFAKDQDINLVHFECAVASRNQ